MVYKNNIEEILNQLFLKYQLLYTPLEEMLTEYESPEKYRKFLKDISNLLVQETAFFYLDPIIIEKVIEITNKNN